MPTVTFKNAFPFKQGLNTTYYEAGWTGDVSADAAKAARTAKALKEKPRGSHTRRPKGDAEGAEG